MSGKLVVTLKKRAKTPAHEESKIDLRHYETLASGGLSSRERQLKGKQLIVNVMSQLIDFTTDMIKASAGPDRKKHQFRLTQFKKALSSINSYPGEITSGADAKQLDGIGKGIADRIDEILKTGTLSELTEVNVVDDKTRIINELTTVTGIGDSNATKFIELGVVGLDDLRQKVSQGTIKITHHMQMGLKYYEDFQQKIPYDEVAEMGTVLKSCVSRVHPDVIVEICGSHRRRKPFSGDIDVLMTCSSIINDDDLIKSPTRYLKNIVRALKEVGFIVDDLTSQGDTKYMGVCRGSRPPHIGHRIDIRFVTFESFYPAILYFTGSMMLNKLMRTIALQKQYTLNEYGIYSLATGKKEDKIVVRSEKEIFDMLGIVYLEPFEREIV